MPLLSRFTPSGMLAMSSKPSHAENIYHSMVASQGGNFAVTAGSRSDGRIYAQAMAFARAWLTCERAGNQAHPLKVHELLEEREYEYGLVPGPYDTVHQRNAALAARMLLPQGARKTNVASSLLALLGDDFKGYRVTPVAEHVKWPVAMGDQPMNLQLPAVPRKLIRLSSPVTSAGSLSLRYSQVFSDGQPLLVGDVLVIEPENPAQAERVTVTAAFEFANIPFFTATFARSHDDECLATTMPFPQWSSTARHSLVVVSATAAVDPEKRRKINELMARLVAGVSTWSITDGDATETNGPFRVGDGQLGVTTIGAMLL